MSLKSNELRIGNSIIYDVMVITVDSIDKDSINKDSGFIWFNEQYLKPISLTRDIFLKMGAKLETFDCLSWANLKVTCKNGSVVDFTEGDKNGFFEVLIDTEQEIRVRYVHEVQNWYFMYTGGLELNFEL